MYAGNATPKAKGALSIAVPGELAGLYKAWKQHGRLHWKRLVRPAERLARLGFKISPYLHMQMVKTESGILANKGLQDIFTSNGSLLQPGNTCRNEKLAHTLRQISKFGPVALYNGSIGLHLIRDVQKLGGILTMKDLQTYQVKLKEPISTNILGLKLLGMPPPSGGPPMILVSISLIHFGVIFFFSSFNLFGKKKKFVLSQLYLFTVTVAKHSCPICNPFGYFWSPWIPSRN
jgi:gamma-glutamyltranspeptidase/glutathione hydrolase/leukotriene-C4 hydrolase